MQNTYREGAKKPRFRKESYFEQRVVLAFSLRLCGGFLVFPQVLEQNNRRRS